MEINNDISLQRRRNSAVARGVNQTHPIHVLSASNELVKDVNGKEYIDFTGGIGVNNVGHGHQSVVKAISSQLDRYIHSCFAVVPYEPYVQLCERMNALVPGNSNKTHLLTTGSEAVESAIKIARCHTNRTGILVFSDAYHGRSFLTLAMNGKIHPYSAGMSIGSNDVFRARFPNEAKGVTVSDAIESVESLLLSDIAPADLAAVVIEPIQGEGGVNACNPRFMQFLRKCCDKHGAVFIVDEIQSGTGRTGCFFAFEHSDVIPDLVVFGKSIAGGMPLSGVVGKGEIVDSVEKGGLGGTFAGNPLSCVAALAVLDTFDKENLLERAVQIGVLMRIRLDDIISNRGLIANVNGSGAMLAIELFKDLDKTIPDPELVSEIISRAREGGLLLQRCGPKNNAIRFLMPLTIGQDNLAVGLEILEKVIASSIQH